VDRIVPPSFYARPTLLVARELLGRYLVRDTSGGRREGRIIEVEAYIGPKDLACHAAKGRTKRTETLFGPPGQCYVYLIYGMYHCLNVVTERIDYPAAVLIRAVESEAGLIDGPGRLCRAFDIDLALNRHDATAGQSLWIEDRGERIRRSAITALPRIGVEYAGKWAEKPWRFRMRTGPIGPTRRRLKRPRRKVL
jgi:DNA-3-methyladenine glycosylase